MNPMPTPPIPPAPNPKDPAAMTQPDDPAGVWVGEDNDGEVDAPASASLSLAWGFFQSAECAHRAEKARAGRLERELAVERGKVRRMEAENCRLGRELSAASDKLRETRESVLRWTSRAGAAEKEVIRLKGELEAAGQHVKILRNQTTQPQPPQLAAVSNRKALLAMARLVRRTFRGRPALIDPELSIINQFLRENDPDHQ